MNTVVLALLVAVVAALFYYPTFVRIPSAEEVSGNTAQRAATPTAMRYCPPLAGALHLEEVWVYTDGRSQFCPLRPGPANQRWVGCRSGWPSPDCAYSLCSRLCGCLPFPGPAGECSSGP